MSTLIVWLGSHDERLLIAVVTRRRRFLDLCFRAVTHLADPAVAIGFSGGLAVGLVPGMERIGIRASTTLALSHLLVEILKRTVVRARPCLPVGLESLVQPPDRFSFPSGHAAAGLAMAIPLAVGLGLPLGLLALPLGLAVGVSRCYLGVHYPGDVMAGWLIASVSAVTVALGLG
jgi:undecaprenyl-diphosphatase